MGEPTPEQIERLQKTLCAWPTNWQDEGDTKDAIRALLAALEERGREVERLKAWQAETTEQMLYVAGIVERGEGRPLSEGEHVPQAILRYVKSLEAEVERLRAYLRAANSEYNRQRSLAEQAEGRETKLREALRELLTHVRARGHGDLPHPIWDAVYKAERALVLRRAEEDVPRHGRRAQEPLVCRPPPHGAGGGRGAGIHRVTQRTTGGGESWLS